MVGEDDIGRALAVLSKHGDLLRSVFGSPVNQAHAPVRMTVRELWRRYWRAECHSLDCARDEQGRMRTLLEVEVLVGDELRRFGEVELGELTADTWIDMRARRVRMLTRYGRPPTPATRNRELARVRRMCEWSTEPGQRYLAENPMTGVPAEKENNVRRGKIDDEAQLATLLTFCDPQRGAVNEAQGVIVNAFILALIDTGMREAEVCNLRRDGFDHATGRVSLLAMDRKTDEALAPRLTARALAAVLAIPPVVGCTFVFANPKTGKRYHHRWIVELFDAVVEASKMRGPYGEKLTPHVLRHSFVYKARRHWGLSESVIQKMTGHRTRSAFVRYGIVDQEEMDAGYDVRDAKIADATKKLR